MTFGARRLDWAVAMPVMGGLDAARLILREGLRIGAHGFVVKAQGVADLIQAIRDVSAGAIYAQAAGRGIPVHLAG